jgi:ribulose bisphosphate carboxylase small subunit
MRLRRRKTTTRTDAIAGIRRQYDALGIPHAHLTDDQIVAQVRAIAKACRDAGVSFEEAQRAMAASFESARKFATQMEDIGRLGGASTAAAMERLSYGIQAAGKS